MKNNFDEQVRIVTDRLQKLNQAEFDKKLDEHANGDIAKSLKEIGFFEKVHEENAISYFFENSAFRKILFEAITQLSSKIKDEIDMLELKYQEIYKTGQQEPIDRYILRVSEDQWVA